MSDRSLSVARLGRGLVLLTGLGLGVACSARRSEALPAPSASAAPAALAAPTATSAPSTSAPTPLTDEVPKTCDRAADGTFTVLPSPPLKDPRVASTPARGLACREDTVLVSGGTRTFAANRHVTDVPPVASRTASVAPFCMGETEVTYGAFSDARRKGCRECVLARQTEDLIKIGADDRGDTEYDPNLASAPATFAAASAYCRFLGGRLPTRDEWEFAAGGPKGVRFPWGNDDRRISYEGLIHDVCVGFEGQAHPPCNAKASPKDKNGFGLWDMWGNSPEWTTTRYCQCDKTRTCHTLIAVEGASDRGQLEPLEELRRVMPPSHEPGFRCVFEPTVKTPSSK